MKFEEHKFSKRFPPVNCAIFLIHEPAWSRPTPASLSLPVHHRGTAAALILPDGRFWIGVCLCAPGDPFVKATGRQKAVGRAYRAFLKQGGGQGGYSHGQVTIVEAVNDVPFKEPRIQVDYLKSCMVLEVHHAKKRAGAA